MAPNTTMSRTDVTSSVIICDFYDPGDALSTDSPIITNVTLSCRCPIKCRALISMLKLIQSSFQPLVPRQSRLEPFVGIVCYSAIFL